MKSISLMIGIKSGREGTFALELERIFENAECEKSILKIADGDHDALRLIHKYMN